MPEGSRDKANRGQKPSSTNAGTPRGKEKILVAVMGVTGAGKSTLIRTATGRDDVIVGDGLKSCTLTLRLDFA